jgi:hypothetical protein
MGRCTLTLQSVTRNLDTSCRTGPWEHEWPFPQASEISNTLLPNGYLRGQPCRMRDWAMPQGGFLAQLRKLQIGAHMDSCAEVPFLIH